MIEKVNPCHPDKVADRIAGAIVDLAYKTNDNPTCAVEVLIGHNQCNIIIESSVKFENSDIENIVARITGMGNIACNINQVPQDSYLAQNQESGIHCGDNGIFKGMPMDREEKLLSMISRNIFEMYHSDGKYILNDSNLIICQSKDYDNKLKELYPYAIVNPLGNWDGGINVDTGATNRKLGSDMGHALTGGGLHGKDLSKADVSINIYAFLKAQELNKPVELCCAIGDEYVDGIPYSEIVEIARKYINNIGGFEKFAEWGLI